MGWRQVAVSSEVRRSTKERSGENALWLFSAAANVDQV